MESSRQCPHCSADLGDSSFYCPACGAEYAGGSEGSSGEGDSVDTTAICPSCGTFLGAGDTFCPSCGAEKVEEPVRRAFRLPGTALRISGVVIVVAAIVFAFLFLVKIAGKRGTPPVPVTHSTPPGSTQASSVGQSGYTGMLSAQVLTSPCGASAAIPAGPYMYSKGVKLQEIETPGELKKVDLLSPVLKLDAFTGVVFADKVAVDLPSGDAGEQAQVLCLSHLGMWIPLPSSPVQLKNGGQGRRVIIDRVPTPWRLTVARKGPPGSGSADSTGKRLLELEKLSWTDREALEKAMDGVALLLHPYQSVRWRPCMVPLSPTTKMVLQKLRA